MNLVKTIVYHILCFYPRFLVLKIEVQKEAVSDKVPEEKMEEIRKELSDRVLETARKQRARVAKTPRLR